MNLTQKDPKSSPSSLRELKRGINRSVYAILVSLMAPQNRLKCLLTPLLSEAGSFFRMLHRSRILYAAKREGILKRDIFQVLEASRLTCMARPHIGLEQDRAIAG